MSSVNKVILIGHLGADPEVRTVSSGNTVARLNVATSENWTDREGQKQERTEWHRVVVWGKQAEICGKYLSKGRQIYVEGRLQTRSWEDQQGQKKYTTEVIANNIQFLGSQQHESAGSTQPQREKHSFSSDTSTNERKEKTESMTTTTDSSPSITPTHTDASRATSTSSFNKNEDIPF